MTEARVTQLLAAEALAAGRPLGGELRVSLRLNAAAADAEAGNLERALRGAGLPADLAALAVRAPSALRPALRRIDPMPGLLAFHAPLVQALGYLWLVAGIQTVIVAILAAKVLPGLEAEGTAPVSLAVASFAFPVPLVAMSLILASGSTRFPGWARELSQAREAAMQAALAEASADPAAAVFDSAITQAVSRARAEHARLVTVVRLGGLGALALIALRITVLVYGAIASLSGVL